MMSMRIDSKTVWILRKEIKTVLRSRWLLLGFIISPLFAWMFQGMFLGFIVEQAVEPETVYITLDDEGGWGQILNSSIATQVALENANLTEKVLLIERLVPVDRSDGQSLWDNRTASVWLWIPSNFTEILETTNRSIIQIAVNTGNFRASAAAARLAEFSRFVVNEIIAVRDLRIAWEVPTTAEASYGHQLAIFLVMLTSVLAPGPYVSKSFAGERDKHTLEALLVVPISRLKILGAKLVAGLLLSSIYSAFTVVGIVLYNWLIITRATSTVPQEATAYIDLYSINLNTVPLIVFVQFLVLLCAIGIGVVISCLAKDQATAESMNNI
ncbi:MAG: ABC transporter permease subunit, partial [Candidatus Thorarchaeota archaeon]|nr:ABC transporter permease subunit [Candidatus Thorarchaeota archaeon]